MRAINAQTDVGGEEVDPYSHDVLMQGMWKRGDEDVLDQEGDEDDMQYEMVTDADVKRGDIENEINLEPFYSYRRILKNQRWKRTKTCTDQRMGLARGHLILTLQWPLLTNTTLSLWPILMEDHFMRYKVLGHRIIVYSYSSSIQTCFV